MEKVYFVWEEIFKLVDLFVDCIEIVLFDSMQFLYVMKN